jgi:predicted nucleotidyltransferase
MVITGEIKQMVDAIVEALPVEKLYLFGSQASGTATELSDYDFYILIPDNSMRQLDAILKARKSLLPIKQKKSVDILTNYTSRFEQRKVLNTLEKRVAQEGVLLYERA